MKTTILLLSLTIWILPASPAQANLYAPKEDNEILALDLKTGKPLWRFKPWRLSDAHFEVYDKGLVVYPHASSSEKSHPMFLKLQDGKRIEPFDTSPAEVLARPITFWPHIESTWKNLIFDGSGVRLQAFRAGEKEPLWTVYLPSKVESDLDKLYLGVIRNVQVIDAVLYLESNTHIFAFEPSTGKLISHHNLATDLELAGGGTCVFAKSEDVLLISFDRRVVALDLKKDQYLWHVEPDTSRPGMTSQGPFPVIHDGKVFLSAGARAKIHAMDRPSGKPGPGGSGMPGVMRWDLENVPLTVDKLTPGQQLLDALDSGDLKIARALIAAGADVNTTDYGGRAALDRACSAGELSLVKRLIAAGADVNADSKTWGTPLSAAVGRDNKKLVRLLIHAGATVNYQAGSQAFRPYIHTAALYASTGILKILISAGADVNARDERGETPLHYASCWYDDPPTSDQYETIRILVAAGADLAVKNNDGLTPIEEVLASGKKELAKFMMSLKEKTQK